MSLRPWLSIVIPAFNEEARLPRTLEQLRRYLERRHASSEILVVDDGSTDATVRLVEREAPSVQLLRNEVNRGKGYSVRRGMLEASGELRLMCDADLSTPIEELERFEAQVADGAEVVVASRALPGARLEVRQPWYRENAGRLFNLAVRFLAVPGIEDTQCGFKLFTSAAAIRCFSAARLDGFSFDVEALFIARRAGLRIVEIPVIWRNDAKSRVTAASGALAFLDLLRIRFNHARGLYGRL